MKNTYDENYIIGRCKACGNHGLLKKVARYDQKWTEYDSGDPLYHGETDCILLECPVCQSVSLFRSYTNDYLIEEHGTDYTEDEFIYPTDRRVFPNTPKNIVESYRAAVETVRIDQSISLIAIRAVLEKICKERGCKKKTLEAMLKDMVSKNILSDTLDKCSFLIRRLGNSGAHGDELFVRRCDLEELIDFIETIMYYIYELSVKIDAMNKRYIKDEGKEMDMEMETKKDAEPGAG